MIKALGTSGACSAPTEAEAGTGRLFIRMEGMEEKMAEFKAEKAGDVTHVPICHGNGQIYVALKGGCCV